MSLLPVFYGFMPKIEKGDERFFPERWVQLRDVAIKRLARIPNVVVTVSGAEFFRSSTMDVMKRTFKIVWRVVELFARSPFV